MSKTLLIDRDIASRLLPSERPVSLLIHGPLSAADKAVQLMAEGVEFHVEPQPDNDWEFTVKSEARSVLFSVPGAAR